MTELTYFDCPASRAGGKAAEPIVSGPTYQLSSTDQTEGVRWKKQN